MNEMRDFPEHFEGTVDLSGQIAEDTLEKLRADSYRRKEDFGTTKAEGQKVFDFSLSKQEFKLNTSYYVGIGWLIPGQLPFRVRPKLDDQSLEVDYLQMLKDALEDPSVAKHLDNLLKVDFAQEPIAVSSRDEGLNLFVVVQYITLLENMVKRGLLKSFHQEVEVFNNKIKGKILLSSSVAKPKDGLPLKRQFHCAYQTLDENVFVNRLLKSAFLVSRKILARYKDFSSSDPTLERKIVFISKRMQDIRPLEATHAKDVVKLSPFFKKYQELVRLAQLIIRLGELGPTRESDSTVLIPPFWINMTKLFELYALSKLRKAITVGKIDYHLHFHFKEPDFLVTNSGLVTDFDVDLGTFIADAKYKPLYSQRSSALWEDGKQLSGYSRFKAIREYLKATPHMNIPCVILYSDQGKEDYFNFSCLERDNLFEDIFKVGIRLPQKVIEES